MQCFSHLYTKLKCHVWNSSKMLSSVTHSVIETLFKTYNTRTCCYAWLLCCKKKTTQKIKNPTATCTFVTRIKRQKGAFFFMNYMFLIRNKWKLLNYCSYISIRLIKEIANFCYMSFWVWRHFVRFSISRNLSTCNRKTL